MIETIRDALAALLREGTGIAAEPYLPANVTPPLWVVQPTSGTYLEPGMTYSGAFIITFDVCYFAESTSNEDQSQKTDLALEDGIVAVANGGWSVDAVWTDVLTANNNKYLGAVMTVSKEINL